MRVCSADLFLFRCSDPNPIYTMCLMESIRMACDSPGWPLVKCVQVKFRSFKIEVLNFMEIKAYLGLKNMYFYFILKGAELRLSFGCTSH